MDRWANNQTYNMFPKGKLFNSLNWLYVRNRFCRDLLSNCMEFILYTNQARYNNEV
jgi:hypothetical protein